MPSSVALLTLTMPSALGGALAPAAWREVFKWSPIPTQVTPFLSDAINHSDLRGKLRFRHSQTPLTTLSSDKHNLYIMLTLHCNRNCKHTVKIAAIGRSSHHCLTSGLTLSSLEVDLCKAIPTSGGVTASTEMLAAKRHAGVHTPVIVGKMIIANQQMAYAA